MADIPTFLAAFPEFAAGDQNLINAKLQEATRQLDPAIGDDAIYQYAAQKLARTPFGNTAKLSTTDGKTVYDAELDRLRADFASGRGIT